ncbi:Uncharacterised protein [Candidatus Anstonella stagnisolia]|nr:Uncharacterised protein [Candidatus Anstonella stagnisolia]
MKEIETAFSKTTKLLFGRELAGINDYAPWLLRRLPKGTTCKSCASERTLYVPSHSIFARVPRERAAGLDSFAALSAKKIGISENDSLGAISHKLPGISYYITELAEGRNINVEESAVYTDLFSSYRIVDCFYSKYVAYNFLTDYNESTFGCSRNFTSKFSIHCYNSKGVNLAFEADACTNCSGIMFCHNCEHVFDSLFCFNVKNKRYAVLNVEVGREEYLRVKKMLTDYILQNLEKKHSLPFDIFDFVCATVPVKK